MEAANTKLYFTRRYHDTWTAGLEKLYPQKIDEAAAELENLRALLAANQAANPEAEPSARDIEALKTLKGEIRGGAVLNFLQFDGEAHLQESYAILSGPYRHFLNRSLKMGTMLQEFMGLLLQASADDDADVETAVQSKRGELLRRNLNLLTG